MNCPVCHESRMREVEKNGVLIDICPSCKGVWLDRGELEKLMSEVREARDSYNQWYYRDEDEDDDDDKRRRPPQPYRQPESPPYGSQQASYGQQGAQGQPGQHGPYGYDGKQGQYGHKHKKKRSVMDLFGDLFD